MTRSGAINLNEKQIKFIMEILDIRDPKEAIQALGKLLLAENVEPSEMPVYVDKLMERVRVKK